MIPSRLIMGCLLLVAGCGAGPEPRPEERGPALENSPGSSARESSSSSPITSLGLAQALARIDDRHPQLAALRAFAEAAKAQGEQAGAFPNPQLALRMESAPWSSGSTRDEADYVAGLSFQLPHPGRLAAAQEVGNRQADQRLQELSAQRVELHRTIRGAFATALSLERAATVQQQAHELAIRAKELLEALVLGGDAIPSDLARVEMEATRARMELVRVRSLRGQALVALATAMGEPGLHIESLQGDLEQALAIPDLEELTRGLEQNPRIRTAKAEVALNEARVELAKARRIPDVSLDLFYRRLEESNQHGFDVGIAIPLPVFNRNQGGVRSAEARRLGAEARARATKNELVRDLRAAHAQLSRALGFVAILRDELLPKADLVLKSTEARFRAGDANLLEVIPVQREWTALQLEYVNGLRIVMVAWSDLQALTGVEPTP